MDRLPDFHVLSLDCSTRLADNDGVKRASLAKHQQKWYRASSTLVTNDKQSQLVRRIPLYLDAILANIVALPILEAFYKTEPSLRIACCSSTMASFTSSLVAKLDSKLTFVSYDSQALLCTSEQMKFSADKIQSAGDRT